MVNQQEKKTFSRQISLVDVGENGQNKILNSKILVIGAGGLGCPVLLYLASSGVRNLGIVDFDIVDLSNLPRQILFSQDDLGKSKVEVASEKLSILHPKLKINAHNSKLSKQNSKALFVPYDLIIDCTDNFESRYLINDTCLELNKCWIYGSIHAHEGQVSVFNYEGGPVYRDLFPESSTKETAPNCEELGVLATLTGVIGTHMAMEALKVILEIGASLSGRLWLYNSLTSQSNIIQFGGLHVEANTGNNEEVNFVNFGEFNELLKLENTQIIDLRNNWELPRIDHIEHICIPFEQLIKRVDELDSTKQYVVVCQQGIRSRKAIRILKNNGIYNAVSLSAGIEEYLNYEKGQKN